LIFRFFFTIISTSLYVNIIKYSLRYDHDGSVVDPLSPPLDHVHEFDQRVGGSGHPVAQRPASELKQLNGPRRRFHTSHEFGERYDLKTYRTMVYNKLLLHAGGNYCNNYYVIVVRDDYANDAAMTRRT